MPAYHDDALICETKFDRKDFKGLGDNIALEKRKNFGPQSNLERPDESMCDSPEFRL